jgi:Protein of unknown function (DUF3040)
VADNSALLSLRVLPGFISRRVLRCRLNKIDQGHDMRNPAMSLSPWEQRALELIEAGLVRSDPRLAEFLTTLRRPDPDGEIPAEEKTSTAPRLTVVNALRRPRDRRNDRQWGSPESVDTLTWLIFPVRAS